MVETIHPTYIPPYCTTRTHCTKKLNNTKQIPMETTIIVEMLLTIIVLMLLLFLFRFIVAVGSSLESTTQMFTLEEQEVSFPLMKK